MNSCCYIFSGGHEKGLACCAALRPRVDLPSQMCIRHRKYILSLFFLLSSKCPKLAMTFRPQALSSESSNGTNIPAQLSVPRISVSSGITARRITRRGATSSSLLTASARGLSKGTTKSGPSVSRPLYLMKQRSRSVRSIVVLSLSTHVPQSYPPSNSFPPLALDACVADRNLFLVTPRDER